MGGLRGRETNLHRPRHLAGALLAAGICLAAAPAVAGAKPAIGHAYACYAPSPSYYMIHYIGSFKLVSATRYEAAPDQQGNQLKGKISKGTYRFHGDKLTFLTGTYAHLLGRYIVDKRNDSYINLYKHRRTYQDWTGISCPQSGHPNQPNG